ncbi:hypothetical protein K439DRAFT_320841 [Ramaria rubella]|nr:hypothetical protein K439DRAFT_320841 [Ramaria rubella]
MGASLTSSTHSFSYALHIIAVTFPSLPIPTAPSHSLFSKMYPRSIASLSCITTFILLIIFARLVSAAPSARTPGDVVSENRNMACRMGACYIKNATDSSDLAAVSDASETAGAASTSSIIATTPGFNAAPGSSSSANGATLHKSVTVTFPIVIAGTSLLLIF